MLDELIAELSQKLVEYNVDECAKSFSLVSRSLAFDF